MTGLARFALKSPVNAALLAALFAVIPLLYFISAALVAVVTLRMGATAGTRTLIAALVGGVISWMLTGIPLSLLVLTLTTLLALMLRASESWKSTLFMSVVLGVFSAMLLQVLFQEQFNMMLDALKAFMAAPDAGIEQDPIDLLKPIAGLVIVSLQVVEATLSLLLARYWQAKLYNPGGLARELHVLRLSWQEATIYTLLSVVCLYLQPALIMLVSFPFIFVGMATLHGIVAKLKLGGQWLVAAYIALILFNQLIVPLLVLLVLVDSLGNLRSRIPESTGSNNK